jgi:hypothetical protein
VKQNDLHYHTLPKKLGSKTKHWHIFNTNILK